MCGVFTYIYPPNYPNAGSLEPHWLVLVLYSFILLTKVCREAGLDSHDINENIHPSKTNMEPQKWRWMEDDLPF